MNQLRARRQTRVLCKHRGYKSLVAEHQKTEVGALRKGESGAGRDDLWAMVAPHGVKGDPHGIRHKDAWLLHANPDAKSWRDQCGPSPGCTGGKIAICCGNAIPLP